MKNTQHAWLRFFFYLNLFFVSFGGTSFAGGHNHSHGDDPHGCKGALGVRIDLIASGRDHDVIGQFQNDFDMLYKPGGILQKLHIDAGNHIVAEFVQGTEMDALASTGRPPVGVWPEGRQIVQMARSPGLIYEFVASGCNKRHSYYRDTVGIEEQRTIMLHVAGHYHFNVHSHFAHVRSVDVPTESLELYEMIDQYMIEHGHDEVSEWYQFLMSLEYSQDLTHGSFTAPELFMPPHQLLSPTASVLQAFVANLPSSTPEWKKKMALKFEHIHRYYSASAPTKIMNEGWATILQEIVAEHAGWNDFNHAMIFSGLIRGVARRGDIKNPYWLGREAWRRIQIRFNESPAVQGLSRIDRDAAFVDYATKNFISKYGDYDFLRIALDAQWVRDRKLVLSRQMTGEEMWALNGKMPPPPEDDPNPTPRIVVSNDPQRVINHVVKAAADLRWSMPRLEVRDLNIHGSGMVALGFNAQDSVGNSIPLERNSMVQNLYVLARIMERPMSLDTVALNDWPGFAKPSSTPPSPWNPWEPKDPAQSIPMRVVVEPNGLVKIYKKQGSSEKPQELPVVELTSELQAVLDLFRKDLSLSESEKLQEETTRRFQGLVQSFISDMGNHPPMGLYLHAATAAKSVEEFTMILNRRMLAMFQAALRGENLLIRGATGVKIRVLPVIPHLSFDHQALNALAQEVEPAPVDVSFAMSVATPSHASAAHNRIHSRAAGSPFHPDDVLDPETHPGKPGDPYWGPGKGDGNGDGEGDGDGDSTGDEPGQGGNDPTLVEIPLELYSRALGELVELPRLRPKQGLSNKKEEVESGYVTRRAGVTDYVRLRRRAFKLGVGLPLSAEERAQDPAQERSDEVINNLKNPRAALLRGAAALRAQDWIVKDVDKVRQPELNAIITIAIDMSGSMMGDPLIAAKRMTYDLRALLLNKYKRLEFRYIAFDGVGHIYRTLEEMLKANLGGGTSYAEGLKKVLEVHKDYPRALWDRYVIGIGDMGDFGEPGETMKVIKEITNQSEYTGIVAIGPGADTPLAKACDDYSKQDPWFGFYDLPEGSAYKPIIFKKLFKNEP